MLSIEMCDDFIPQVWKKETTCVPAAIFIIIHNLWRTRLIYLILNELCYNDCKEPEGTYVLFP